MTDDEAFLAAIRARPDDDNPRLYYADWLEDQGQGERAEFIRVQCEMERIRGKADPRQGVDFEKGTYTSPPELEPFISLRKRADELLAAHARDWLDSLNFPTWQSVIKGQGWQVAPNGAIYARFVRGFVEEVELPAAAWDEHGDAITAAHPVRTVRLTAVPDPWHEFIDAGGRVIGRHPNGDAKTCRSSRWPGVTLELPSTPTVITRVGGRGMEIDLTGGRTRELAPGETAVYLHPETMVVSLPGPGQRANGIEVGPRDRLGRMRIIPVPEFTVR